MAARADGAAGRCTRLLQHCIDHGTSVAQCRVACEEWHHAPAWPSVAIANTPSQYFIRCLNPLLCDLSSPADVVIRRWRVMRRGRREYLCDLTQKNFEIRSWSAAVTVAMSATGASAMACYGGQPASSFQNAVTVLHLETKLKLYIPTDSYKLYLYLSQLSARCQQGSSQRVSAPDASARRWLPPREPLSLRRCRARAPCRGARCETPPMGTGARLAAL